MNLLQAWETCYEKRLPDILWKTSPANGKSANLASLGVLLDGWFF